MSLRDIRDAIAQMARTLDGAIAEEKAPRNYTMSVTVRAADSPATEKALREEWARCVERLRLVAKASKES